MGLGLRFGAILKLIDRIKQSIADWVLSMLMRQKKNFWFDDEDAKRRRRSNVNQLRKIKKITRRRVHCCQKVKKVTTVKVRVNLMKRIRSMNYAGYVGMR